MTTREKIEELLTSASLRASHKLTSEEQARLAGAQVVLEALLDWVDEDELTSDHYKAHYVQAQETIKSLNQAIETYKEILDDKSD